MQPQTEDNKASLGFSNMLRENLLKQKHAMPEQEMAPQEAETPQEQSQPEEPQDQAPTEEATPSPEIQSLDAKMNQMEITHEKELAMLRADISKDKMKGEFEAKIKALEDAHKKEMTAVRDEIKTILNA